MITTYQIRNVLRIYGNQLKKKTLLLEDTALKTDQVSDISDIVDISLGARRKQMMNQISNNIFAQISQKEIPSQMGNKNPADTLGLNLEVERGDYEN